MIDIGHERTDVVVVAAGKAVFSRSIARAGKQVTEAIQRNWRLSWDEAERAKHSDGLHRVAAEPATSRRVGERSRARCSPSSRRSRAICARRSRRAARAPVSPPIAALLVGGGARLRGMGSFLAEQLGIPAWRLTGDDASRSPARGSAPRPRRPCRSTRPR